jgi:hypothetical protein
MWAKPAGIFTAIAKSKGFQMVRRGVAGKTLSAALVAVCSSAFAGWGFNGAPLPNAFIQTGNMTLELQCDRIRFAPAGYEDAQDIERKQGLSIRFMKDGATEIGAFQAGGDNADIRIVDNYPVEVTFRDSKDYDFVLDQIGKNAALNLAMIDRDVTYGIFDLHGSSAAIKALRAACGSRANSAAARASTLCGASCRPRYLLRVFAADVIRGVLALALQHARADRPVPDSDS